MIPISVTNFLSTSSVLSDINWTSDGRVFMLDMFFIRDIPCSAFLSRIKNKKNKSFEQKINILLILQALHNKILIKIIGILHRNAVKTIGKALQPNDTFIP